MRNKSCGSNSKNCVALRNVKRNGIAIGNPIALIEANLEFYLLLSVLRIRADFFRIRIRIRIRGSGFKISDPDPDPDSDPDPYPYGHPFFILK